MGQRHTNLLQAANSIHVKLMPCHGAQLKLKCNLENTLEARERTNKLNSLKVKASDRAGLLAAVKDKNLY